ncbi:MAG: hypothetical protein R3C09_18690 [Pirellulaceae bacterium]
MRQIPAYESSFQEAFGGEPSYGNILDAVAAFVILMRSQNVPLDLYLATRTPCPIRRFAAWSRSKARPTVSLCHHGPLF